MSQLLVNYKSTYQSSARCLPENGELVFEDFAGLLGGGDVLVETINNAVLFQLRTHLALRPCADLVVAPKFLRIANFPVGEV